MIDLTTSPYVRRAREQLTVVAVTALILAVVAGAIGIISLNNVMSRSTAQYDEITGMVESEYIQSEATGSRRNRHLKQVRYVTVTLEDGDTGDVRSESLKVGSEATIYRDVDSGELRESPDRPAIWRWVFALGAIAVAVGMLLATLHQLRRRSALGAVADDTPGVDFDVTAVSTVTERRDEVRKIVGVVRRSDLPSVRTDDTIELTVGRSEAPDQLRPAVMGLVVRDTGSAPLLAWRSRPDGDWWLAEVVNLTRAR